MKNTNTIKKGIIIYYGEYPCNESWPNRIKNFTKIFGLLSLNYKIVVPYPPQNSGNHTLNDPRIIRLHRTKLKSEGILDVLHFLIGILKSYLYVKRQSNLDFVLFAGGSFAICYPILRICKRRKIKVWIDIVDENSKKFEAQKSLRDYLAVFNKDLFDKWLIPQFDKILVISDFLFNKYNKVNTNIQKSVPTIIDLEEFEKNSLKNLTGKNPELDILFIDNRLKLLYAGSAVRPNGILFVLDCVAELIINQKYDFLIAIIFLMGDKEIILKHASNLGIENKLFLLNRQDQEDLPAIYKQCDILFLPEHGSIIANAGFPGKTAELLASGKPIISTIFSDLDKYLKNEVNSFLAPIGDHISYISNLKKLLDDKDLRNRIGEKGRQTAISNFDYRCCTKMFAELATKET